MELDLLITGLTRIEALRQKSPKTLRGIPQAPKRDTFGTTDTAQLKLRPFKSSSNQFPGD
jgi:hypothetical protein